MCPDFKVLGRANQKQNTPYNQFEDHIWFLHFELKAQAKIKEADGY